MLARFCSASILAYAGITLAQVSQAFAQAPPPAAPPAAAPPQGAVPTPAPPPPAGGPAAPAAPAPGAEGAAAPAAAPVAAPEAAPAAAEGKPPPADPVEAQPNENPNHTLVADAEEGSSPVEHPGKSYYFVGARYRGVIVPKFMMNMFADGGDTVYVHGFGPEFGARKDGFETVFSAWYAAYSMDATLFKGKSDEEDAWEFVESEVKVVYLTADFLWSHEVSPEFAINYGFGAGFGIVFGDLHRVQAYRDDNGKYFPCVSEGNPATQANYCGTDNDHYGDYTEPSWSDGGSKPIVFPWITLQTGLRYKPHRNVVGRLDLGFGTSGFLLGVGADYGI
jgi:hypothetical protein